MLISKCHTCGQCQAIQSIARQSSSAVRMGWFFYRIYTIKVKANSNVNHSYHEQIYDQAKEA